MAHYSFVTHWKFAAPLERVWKEIRDMDSWPEWWRYVKSVEVITTGDENDIGSVRRIVWKTALLYHLRFDSELVSIDFHKRMEGRAFGDLTGTGLWTFTYEAGITTVRYDWTVHTTKKWMNFLDPIARPLFRWNHDMVMKGGHKGLIRKLATD